MAYDFWVVPSQDFLTCPCKPPLLMNLWGHQLVPIHWNWPMHACSTMSFDLKRWDNSIRIRIRICKKRTKIWTQFWIHPNKWRQWWGGSRDLNARAWAWHLLLHIHMLIGFLPPMFSWILSRAQRTPRGVWFFGPHMRFPIQRAASTLISRTKWRSLHATTTTGTSRSSSE